MTSNSRRLPVRPMSSPPSAPPLLGASSSLSQKRNLRHLISAMRWDEAQTRLASHPSEAELLAPPLGETALHAACRIKAPPALISALLDTFPFAAVLRLAGSGRTPLHLACSDLRRTALGRGFDDDAATVRLLLRSRPDAASLADADGWLPLHCACSSGPGHSSPAAPLSMLRDLLEAYPSSPLAPNRGGVTPLSMLWNNSALNEEDGRITLSADAARFHDRIDEVERRRAELAAGSPDYSRRAFTARQDSAGVWARVLLMVRAAYAGAVGDGADSSGGGGGGDGGSDSGEDESAPPRSPRPPPPPFRPLHALAGVDCPPSAVEFAVRVHCGGDEPMADPLLEPDERGNLPLHIAASRAGGLGSDPDAPGGEDASASSRGSVVRTLLVAGPEAASAPNGEGRLAIHLAAGAGAAWEDCVGALFKAAPEALGMRDAAGTGGLYPFMVAAKAGSVEVCYRLLRHNPGLVAIGLGGP